MTPAKEGQPDLLPGEGRFFVALLYTSRENGKWTIENRFYGAINARLNQQNQDVRSCKKFLPAAVARPPDQGFLVRTGEVRFASVKLNLHRCSSLCVAAVHSASAQLESHSCNDVCIDAICFSAVQFAGFIAGVLGNRNGSRDLSRLGFSLGDSSSPLRSCNFPQVFATTIRHRLHITSPVWRFYVN